VLDLPIEGQIEPVRAKRHPRPPVLMTKTEVQGVLGQMQGTHLLMAKLLYGCGMRLMECVRLRVQDIDFERSLVYVRAAKGGKDRTKVLSKPVQNDLRLGSSAFTRRISP
jgi:integrase